MALVFGLLIPFLGTVLGAAFVFFMKDDLSPRVQKTLLGFASGVMVAASVWSLLIPAMEMETDSGKWSPFKDDCQATFFAGQSGITKCFADALSQQDISEAWQSYKLYHER